MRPAIVSFRARYQFALINFRVHSSVCAAEPDLGPLGEFTGAGLDVGAGISLTIMRIIPKNKPR